MYDIFVIYDIPVPNLKQKFHSGENQKIWPLTLHQELIHNARCLDPIHQRLWQRRSRLRVFFWFYLFCAVGRFVFLIMHPGLYVHVLYLLICVWLLERIHSWQVTYQSHVVESTFSARGLWDKGFQGRNGGLNVHHVYLYSCFSFVFARVFGKRESMLDDMMEWTPIRNAEVLDGRRL